MDARRRSTRDEAGAAGRPQPTGRRAVKRPRRLGEAGADRISSDLDEGREIGRGGSSPLDVDMSAEVLTMRPVDFRPEEFPEGAYGASGYDAEGVERHGNGRDNLGALMETYNLGAMDVETGRPAESEEAQTPGQQVDRWADDGGDISDESLKLSP